MNKVIVHSKKISFIFPRSNNKHQDELLVTKVIVVIADDSSAPKDSLHFHNPIEKLLNISKIVNIFK